MAKVIDINKFKPNPDRWQDGVYDETDLTEVTEVMLRKLFDVQCTTFEERRKNHIVNAENILRILYSSVIVMHAEAFGREATKEMVKGFHECTIDVLGADLEVP